MLSHSCYNINLYMIFKNIDTPEKYEQRREIVFILLAGLFIGTLAMLNILGITRLIDLSFSVFGFDNSVSCIHWRTSLSHHLFMY